MADECYFDADCNVLNVSSYEKLIVYYQSVNKITIKEITEGIYSKGITYKLEDTYIHFHTKDIIKAVFYTGQYITNINTIIDYFNNRNIIFNEKGYNAGNCKMPITKRKLIHTNCDNIFYIVSINESTYEVTLKSIAGRIVKTNIFTIIYHSNIYYKKNDNTICMGYIANLPIIKDKITEILEVQWKHKANTDIIEELIQDIRDVCLYYSVRLTQCYHKYNLLFLDNFTIKVMKHGIFVDFRDTTNDYNYISKFATNVSSFLDFIIDRIRNDYKGFIRPNNKAQYDKLKTSLEETLVKYRNTVI